MEPQNVKKRKIKLLEDFSSLDFEKFRKNIQFLNWTNETTEILLTKIKMKVKTDK